MDSISKKIISFFFLSQVLFISCVGFEDKLYSYIEEDCDFSESDTSNFALSKAIGIDNYDTLYILQEWISDNEVADMIHINYRLPFHIGDSQRGFVFVKSGKVIKAELLPQHKVFIQQYDPIINDTFMVWRQYDDYLKEYKYLLFQ